MGPVRIIRRLIAPEHDAIFAGIAQLVRALDCGSRGPRFNPESRCHFAFSARFMAILLAFLLNSAFSDAEPSASTGPRTGSLILVGGGSIGPEIIDRFLLLAGGRDAPIVVIPSAGDAREYPQSWRGADFFRKAGATKITILHTRNRDEADSEAFTAPLREAQAVWFSGGRQWRLVDAYAGTQTEIEIAHVLNRGGVIGGSSAGATIQGSYLVRGAREGNHVMMAPGYERGFGYLKRCAVDQHLITRGRVDDLVDVIRAHTELLGIGIDESTAIVVQGDSFEVVGKSKVAIYRSELLDQADALPYEWLMPGDRFDLRLRRPIAE